MTQRAILDRQQADTRIDAVRRRIHRRVEQPVATLDPILLDLGANEIGRAALPCTPELHRFVLCMEPAHARSVPEGERRNLSPTRTSPENTVPVTIVPVPGKEKLRSTARRRRPICMAHRHDPGGSRSQRFECRDAASDEDRDRQDGGRGEARLHQETAERGANLSDPIGVNEVALTQRDYSAFDSEQIDDLEMLPRLRHRRFIGSNDQQHECPLPGCGRKRS